MKYITILLVSLFFVSCSGKTDYTTLVPKFSVDEEVQIISGFYKPCKYIINGYRQTKIPSDIYLPETYEIIYNGLLICKTFKEHNVEFKEKNLK